MKIISWCLKNDIKIYPVPISKSRNPGVNIDINFQSKLKKGKEIYTQQKVHEKIYELYKVIYYKMN
tara:strand:- start:171 stop:368 length:198 start_codon:yes stop_codon:yes gene_type:complete